MDESLPPLTPVRLGEYLESKGQIQDTIFSLAPAGRMKRIKRKQRKRK